MRAEEPTEVEEAQEDNIAEAKGKDLKGRAAQHTAQNLVA